MTPATAALLWQYVVPAVAGLAGYLVRNWTHPAAGLSAAQVQALQTANGVSAGKAALAALQEALTHLLPVQAPVPPPAK